MILHRNRKRNLYPLNAPTYEWSFNGYATPKASDTFKQNTLDMQTELTQFSGNNNKHCWCLWHVSIAGGLRGWVPRSILTPSVSVLPQGLRSQKYKVTVVQSCEVHLPVPRVGARPGSVDQHLVLESTTGALNCRKRKNNCLSANLVFHVLYLLVKDRSTFWSLHWSK